MTEPTPLVTKAGMNLDKFESAEILGVKFWKIDKRTLISYITSAAKNPEKKIVGYLNVRGANLAYTTSWYRDFMNSCDLIFCDGFGILLGLRMLGQPFLAEHRMTCPDYIEQLAQACAMNNSSLFLLAGKPGVAEKAAKKLTESAPGLRVGYHHGYFEKTGAENDSVIQKINDFSPDILYIGFGMPIQERWILDNYDRVNTQVFLPLGACLDFFTGSVYRGPNWMTDFGFEWLARLITEPGRLWKRYILGNPVFIYRVVKHHCLGLSIRS